MTDEQKKAPQLATGDFGELDGATIASIGDDPNAAGAEQELPPGSQAGRYLILEQLGRGGMGVVYKAYDPELDRRIALKLLRVKRDSLSRADRARDRLLREAQALAQLSHPNVVSAFDVGTIGADVFVAMELVEGKTLSAWIKQARPDHHQIAAVMLAAGRGIAAAHRAGLIHRDIKPDNILVGDDGRVRVLDFGLARVAKAPESMVEDLSSARPENSDSNSSLDGDSLSGSSRLHSHLTMDGAVVGTPGYMAPEQYLGGRLDEMGDQYSFCVTLYEALYGQRPFRSRTFRDLKTKVTAGKMDPPPPQARVHKHWRRIVQQGLAVEPANRFSSMDQLLQELARDPRVRRRRLVAVGAMVLLVVASFGAAYAFQAQRQGLCQGARDQLAQVWDAPVRDKIRDSFMASGRSYAPDTFSRVAKNLDAYASAWIAMRTEACEATHVHGEQSESLLDKRMQCLDRRRGELRALTGLFADQVDAKVLDKSVQASFSLTSLESCADTEALTAAIAPPTDPQVRQKVHSLQAKLDQAWALIKAGKYRESEQRAQAVAAEVAELSYLPIRAEASYFLGIAHFKTGASKSAEQSLRRAMKLAAEAGDSRTFIKAGVELVYVIGYHLAKYEEALWTGEFVESVVLLHGRDSDLLAKLRTNLGVIQWVQGKYAEALPRFEKSLAYYHQRFGQDHQRVAFVLNALGNVLADMGRWQESKQKYERVLAIRERLYGSDHPSIASALSNLGTVLAEQKQFDQAIANYQRAYLILKGVHGQKHFNVSLPLYNLGEVYLSQKKYALAIETCAQALAIAKASLKKGHPLFGHFYTCLGLAHRGRDGAAKGIAPLEQALQIRQANKVDPSLLARTRYSLARVLWESGRDRKRALVLAQQACASLRAAGEGKQESLHEVEAWLLAHNGD